MLTRRAKDRMVGRVWRVDVMYPLDGEEGRRGYMRPGGDYFVAAVRADDNPEKLFRRLELHAIVYPSPLGFGKGCHRT